MPATYRHILSSIGKKAMMAVSGAGLGLFLLLHLLGNATVFLGRDAFLAYAARLHRPGSLTPLLEVALLAVFLLHITLGLTLYREHRQARPTRYLIKKEAGDTTLGARTMPHTGLILLIFLIAHVLTFRGSGHGLTIADLLRRNFHQPGPVLFTVVAVLALVLHASHGFWSLLQSLGLHHPAYDPFLRQGAWLLSLAGCLLLALIPVVTFLVHDFLL